MFNNNSPQDFWKTEKCRQLPVANPQNSMVFLPEIVSGVRELSYHPLNAETPDF